MQLCLLKLNILKNRPIVQQIQKEVGHDTSISLVSRSVVPSFGCAVYL